MARPTVRSFDQPDEVRTIQMGQLDIVHLGDLALGRLTQEPGWHWKEHVASITGTHSCQSHHVGFVIAGRAHVVMDDGTEFDLAPGNVIDIPPGHDAWVVGDEAHVTLAFSGVRSWAKAAVDGDRAVVLTLLMTDIVGSTAVAERLGDSAWRELLADHHADMRALLERFAGTEVKTTGDGMISTFQSAERAVMAGLAARDAAASRGISIRTGIHTGEVAQVAGDVRGLAVHMCARIVALAGPDEVLASSTTHALAEAAAVIFSDRGRHALKGFSAEKQLYAIDRPT